MDSRHPSSRTSIPEETSDDRQEAREAIETTAHQHSRQRGRTRCWCDVPRRCRPTRSRGGAVRTFRSFTGDLHRLADWLKEVGITTIAMESTGVYWIPVFE